MNAKGLMFVGLKTLGSVYVSKFICLLVNIRELRK